MSTLASFAARYSDRDMVVDGYTVPANTPIIHALGVSLKNETQWEDVYKCVTHTFTDMPLKHLQIEVTLFPPSQV